MTQTLAQALDTVDMLMIDDLYAFDLYLDEEGLTVICMDGRDERRWDFTPEQVAAATPEADSGCWEISGAEGKHRLRLLDAVSAEDDSDQE